MITTNGWILYKRFVRETSVDVTIFTPLQGLIKAQFRGGRVKSGSLLQPFTPLWFSIAQRYKWHYINRMEPHGACYTLIGYNLFSSLYINELLYHLLPEGEAVLSLFEQYSYLLSQLSLNPDKLTLEVLLRQFEWQLLSVSGYGILLTELSSGQALIEPSQYYQLTPEGLCLTKDSMRGFSGAHLLAYANGGFDDSAVLITIKRLTRQLIHHALGGRELMTRQLFSST